MKKFLQMLAGSFVAKALAAMALALLAFVGLGPERFVRVLVSWWTSDPSYFVLNLVRAGFEFIAFTIASILVGAWIKNRFWPPPINHAENIILAAGLTPQTISPLLLIADAKTPNVRLRIVVEYSYLSRGHFGGPLWVKSRQVQLADLSGVIKGQQIRLPVVSCKP